jgi:hypothetical protein
MSEPAWRSRLELAEAGWTKHAVDNALRRGRASSVTRGVLLPTHAATDLSQRCGAALATQHPRAAISRRTAALARKFGWLPDDWSVDPLVCVDAPRDDTTRSARQGLDRRLSALPDEDVALWHGLRVTTAARTAVDLARDEPRNVVLPILDWLLTTGTCSRADMVAVMDRMVSVPHVRRARAFVDLAREGVASPRETHTRLHMVDAGLPDPDTNLLIVEDDLVLAQGDLGYWRWLIWIEYDGVDAHAERRLNGIDQAKDRWLRRRGWDVFRLTNRDHYEPRAFLAQVAESIREAPDRIAALDPRKSPEVARARRLLGLDQPPCRRS